MIPAVSPKKTWEGFAGGMVWAVAAALVLNHFYLKEVLNGNFGSAFQTETVLRADIDAIQSTGQSLMPEGLEKGINFQEMADLLAFLKNWRY